MKKVIILCSIFIGLQRPLYTQVTQEWDARFNGWGNGFDIGRSVAIDNSGNVYVTGETTGNNGTNLDFATIKYNSFGDQLWVKRYNGPTNSDDGAYRIIVDDSSNVYVTGRSTQIGVVANDYLTIKYNASGFLQWIARYNGPGNDNDQVSDIALDDSGNVYITGSSWGKTEDGNVFDYATIKYNSAGAQQWVARYHNSWDEAFSIALDDFGNVYVTGLSGGQGTRTDYATIKYNSFGVEQWVVRYNGAANDIDEAYSIAVDDSCNVYVTGKSWGDYYDYVTIKYNSSGVQQWLARYNGPGSSYDEAHCLAIDDFGNVYVLGWSVGSGTGWYDYATIKYNSNGTQQWVARYNGPGDGEDTEAYSLTLDDSCNVYVTGRSTGMGTGFDYATIKYNSAGVQQWVERYDGPVNGRDEATALAVDAAGNVYVTGWSYGSGTDWDYATVKYSQYPTSIEPISSEIPKTFELYQNYPNPFNPSTSIQFSISSLPTGQAGTQFVTLKVFDVLGSEVAVLVNEEKPAGKYQVNFNANGLSSGVYFYSLRVNDKSFVKNMVLMK